MTDARSAHMETVESLRDVSQEETWTYYDRLRRAGDIVWDEGARAWLVSSYDLLKRVALETGDSWESFLVYNEDAPQFGLTEAEWNDFNNHGSTRTLMGTTGPGHDRMHRWFMRAFSPKTLAAWGDRLIEPIARQELDRIGGLGHAELYADYCQRVTPRVTAAVLGLPWEDDELFGRLRDLRERTLELLSYSQRPWQSPASAQTERAIASSRELVQLVHPSVLAKRKGAGDDFVSTLWRDADAFFEDEYTERDVTAAALNAWFGATATTTGGAGNALYIVLIHEGLQERIRAGGAEVAKRVVEETLRLFSPSHLIRRIAKKDTELGGVRIGKGEAILALTSAGSRDPRRYACPADVDLERPAPRDHFGFFMGPRTCAGQGLARFLMERMLLAAVDRLANLRFDPSAPAPRFGGTQQRHWKPIHVLFDAASSG